MKEEKLFIVNHNALEKPSPFVLLKSIASGFDMEKSVQQQMENVIKSFSGLCFSI